MSRKTAVSIGMIVGSIIGGYVPGLWGAGMLSYWGILMSGIGAIVGIYIAYRFTE